MSTPTGWQFDSFGEEHLRCVPRPADAVARYQVRVRLRACALNYRDLLMVRGHYDPRMRLPLVPLSDGVGEVVEVGPDVHGLAVGDRVAGCFAPDWQAGAPSREALRTTRGGPIDGMLQQELVGDATGFVRVPEHLTDEEAATLPCAALTAWNALHGVQSGERVLIQGTGGVAIFALQFARLRGAEAVVLSKDEGKRQRAEALGAMATLDYQAEPRWGKKVAELGGVHRVIELGGASTINESLRAIHPGGEIALIGILGGAKTELLLTKVLMNAVKIRGILVGHRADFEAMNQAIAAAELRPVVDRVFDYEAAPEAFSYLSEGKHFGKVCIRIA